MNISTRMKPIAFVVACTFAAIVLGETPAPKETKTKIYKIDSVNLAVSGAAKVKVSAVGKVRTSGWTGAQLVPSSDRKESAGDGAVITMHYDFVATKPSGVVNPVISPITAETTLPAPPAGKTIKVIVRSETNEKEDSLGSPHREP